MLTKRLQIAVFFMFTLLTLTGVYLANKNVVTHGANNSSLASDLHCDFNNLICAVNVGTTQVVATFSAPPEIEEPITISLNSDIPIEIEAAWIEGVNMYMGKIPIVFEKHNEIWTAWFMLGQCSQPDMQWKIVLKTKGQQMPALLFFTTTSR